MSDEQERTQEASTAIAPVEVQRQPCAFFLKTGSCAFGDQCKFEHPADQPPTQYNSLGYPLRPGEPDCAYYVKNVHCGYGASCKFHHAEPIMSYMPVAMMDNLSLHGRPAPPMSHVPRGATGVHAGFGIPQIPGQMIVGGRPMVGGPQYMMPQFRLVIAPQPRGPSMHRLNMQPTLPGAHLNQGAFHHPQLQPRGAQMRFPGQLAYQGGYFQPQMNPALLPGGLDAADPVGQVLEAPAHLHQPQTSRVPSASTSLPSGEVLLRPGRTGPTTAGPSRSRFDREKGKS